MAAIRRIHYNVVISQAVVFIESHIILLSAEKPMIHSGGINLTIESRINKRKKQKKEICRGLEISDNFY